MTGGNILRMYEQELRDMASSTNKSDFPNSPALLAASNISISRHSYFPLHAAPLFLEMGVHFQRPQK
jgi:hypothetical protein